jgi:LysM repeat protein
LRHPRNHKAYCLMASLLGFFLALNISLARESGEESYSISLVQTAEVDKEIIEVDDKKVLTESYSVKKGDYLWRLFRERGLLKKRSLPQLLTLLKRLNKDLENLDLVHPGQMIIIPLTVSPIKGMARVAGKTPETVLPIKALKDMDLDNYTVKPGDSLIKVIRDRYNISPKELHDEYLELVKKLNPSIRDLNTIYPNQTVRLPIYSPQVVRMPIKPTPPTPPPEPRPEAPKKAVTALSRQLGEIFLEIGEEWVGTGQHFIPLKSGGQVNLNADSFPIINLSSGNRIIVDLYHDLPEKMARMIVSNWDNYRVVHLAKEEDLKGALGKILPACDYPKVYGSDEPLVLAGDIPTRITADWIIQSTAGTPEQGRRITMITITDGLTPRTPEDIKGFLGGLGVKVIDYPPGDRHPDEGKADVEVLTSGQDLQGLIENLLHLIGKDFSRRVEIPIYQSQQTHFNLVVRADFLLHMDDRDYIIDLTGLGQDVLALLREHAFSVLSIPHEKDPAAAVSKTLGFLDVTFDSEPHTFMTTNRADTKNIGVTIPGITFQGRNGENIFATPLRLPDGIARYLSRKGFRILSLALS